MNNYNDDKQNYNFGALRRYKDDKDLTINFAISEFIDNSISNFEQECIGTLKQLSIKIIYFCDEKKYWIIDNANGIDDLSNAMKIFKNTFLKSNTSKNQYGYGMKSAIFFLGKWGTIFTKCPSKDHFEKGEFVPEGEDENYKNLSDIDIQSKDVLYRVSEIDESKNIPPLILKEINNGGTCIQIENVFNHKGLTTEQTINNLWTFLYFRYYRYIKNKVDDIRFSLNIFTVDKNKFKPIPQPHEHNIFDEAVQIKNLKENWNSEVNSYKEKVMNNSEYNYVELKKYYDSLFENDKLIFENEEIIITGQDNVEYTLKAKICFINPNNKKDNKVISNAKGLAIIHSNRYICHPGANNDETNLYNFYINDRDCDSYWKWLYGEVELENFPNNQDCDYIMPDKNKRKIIFSSESNITEDDFKHGLKNYLTKIHPFLKFLVYLNKNNDDKNEIKKEILKLKKGSLLQKNISLDEEKNILTINKEVFKDVIPSNENFNSVNIKTINDDKKPILNLLNNENGNYFYEFNNSFDIINKDTIQINIQTLFIKIDLALKSGKVFNSAQELIDYILKDK